MRASVDTDIQSVNQLTAEPASEDSTDQTNDAQRDRCRARMIRHGPTKPPTRRKKNQQAVVGQEMPDADSSGARSCGKSPPVHETEKRRDNAADHPGGN